MSEQATILGAFVDVLTRAGLDSVRHFWVLYPEMGRLFGRVVVVRGQLLRGELSLV